MLKSRSCCCACPPVSPLLAALCCWLTACAGTQLASGPLLPDEAPYLEDLQQLTFGGENAEAYWSFDGKQLSMQIRREGEGCDRIYRMPVLPESKSPIRVSQQAGATTCAHFFPGGELLYASTHLAGEACPPRPDMSQGYVWALYDSYDIFSAKQDGSGLLPLTNNKGYDAEGTVCARDGSIIFTSTRDGDLELYRMDKDGQNVKRLTHTPGYDGGAFFNADCSKIVWRASRPRPGQGAGRLQGAAGQGPGAPVQAGDLDRQRRRQRAMQLTNLDAASFAPSFHPTEDVIVFSSNFGDRRGASSTCGPCAPTAAACAGSPTRPASTASRSSRPTAGCWRSRPTGPPPKGKHDTNVFLARWKGLGPLPAQAEGPADRIRRDVHWLADPAREGRGVGTAGLEQAGAYLEDRLKQLGLEPAGDAGSFRQRFPVVTAVDVKPTSTVVIGGKPVDRTNFAVLGFSAEGKADGPLVLAGYGIVAPEHKIDDYAGLDVKGKVVLVRRFAPEDERTGDATMRRRLGDLRRKAWVAREQGAAALVVVDWPLPPKPAPPDWQPAAESPLLPPSPSGAGDAGLPVLMVKRVAVARPAAPADGAPAGDRGAGRRAAVHPDPGLQRRRAHPRRQATGRRHAGGRGPLRSPGPGRAVLAGARQEGSRTSAPTTTRRAPPPCWRWPARWRPAGRT